MNRIDLVYNYLFDYKNDDLYNFIVQSLFTDVYDNLLKHIEKDIWYYHLYSIVNYDIPCSNKNVKNNIPKRIIGLCGKKFSGKDTVANYLSKKGYYKYALADPLKQICKIIFDFNDDQLYGNLKEKTDHKWKITPRQVFKYIGTEIFRDNINKILDNSNSDFWINILINKIRNSNREKIVISDIRFQNEIDIIQKEFNCIFININRTNNNLIDDLHISENSIDNLEGIDHIIDNNSSYNDLYDKIEKLNL